VRCEYEKFVEQSGTAACRRIGWISVQETFVEGSLYYCPCSISRYRCTAKPLMKMSDRLVESKTNGNIFLTRGTYHQYYSKRLREMMNDAAYSAFNVVVLVF